MTTIEDRAQTENYSFFRDIISGVVKRTGVHGDRDFEKKYIKYGAAMCKFKTTGPSRGTILPKDVMYPMREVMSYIRIHIEPNTPDLPERLIFD